MSPRIKNHIESETSSLEKKKYLNLLKWFLKLTISGIAIYYVFRKIDFGDVVARFKEANWLFLLLALIFFMVSKLISAYRLQLFFRKIGIHVSDRYNIKLYLLGMFYNLGLPGGIGGDGYKAYLLKKQFPAIKTKNIIAAAFMDRFAGMAVLCSLIVIFFSFVNTGIPFLSFTWVLVFPGILLFYMVLHWFFKVFKPLFYQINLYSMLVQICQIVCAICILMGMGLFEQWNAYVVLFLISSVAAIAPVTIGGIGLREAVLLKGAVWLNLNAELAVSLGIGFYVITALTSLCGAYFAFGRNALIKPDENPDTSQQTP